MKAKKLSLKGFRGASTALELTFDTTKPVTLVFGENATGKSTIADALDFVCNGKLGSLEDRSLASKKKEYVVSVGKTGADLSITLETSSGSSFSASLSKEGPTTTPTGCPDARILRRTNVLQLLDATPKARFDVIRSFVELPAVERAEATLREALKAAKGEYDEAVRSNNQAATALESLWKDEGAPGVDALAWAATESARDVGALEASVSSCLSLLQLIEAGETALSRFDSAAQALGESIAELEKVEAEQAAAQATVTEGGASLLKLLQDANAYVESIDHLDNCPVCEQSVTAENLQNRLNERISEMTELSEAVGKTNAAQSKRQNKEAVLHNARDEFNAAGTAVAEALKSENPQEISSLGIDWSEFDPLLAGDVTDVAVRRIIEYGIAARPPLDERRRLDQKSIDQRNAIKGHENAYRSSLEAAEDLEGLTKKLDEALTVVSDRRKAHVQGVLDSVSSEVERLYVALHPGEGLGGVRFYLKASASGSLMFDGDFLNVKDVPPQAYYSDSHLDTLGMCVFLALAELYADENAIVVLDDVVTSVDGPHLERFMNLLHAEAPKLNQVIVTTHYRPWRDLYRFARGPAGNVQLMELRPWTLPGGIRVDTTESFADELRAALADPEFDRQTISSKAGIQLESILDFITYKYRLKVPRQADPNYTLGDLAGAIDSKFGKLLKVSRRAAGGATTEVGLKDMIDAAVGYGWVRNRAGAHFHSMSGDIPDQQIRNFGAKVLELAEIVICAKCECYPAKDKTGSSWQCECGDVQMYPHAVPT